MEVLTVYARLFSKLFLARDVASRGAYQGVCTFGLRRLGTWEQI